MKNKLRLLPWIGLSLSLAACSSSEPPAISTEGPPAEYLSGLPASWLEEVSPGNGDPFMRQVVAAINRHDSVTARVRQQIDILQRQPIGGPGWYLQQGRGPNMRVRWMLQMQVDDAASRWVTVNDGHYLWIDESLPDAQLLRQISLPRFRDAWIGSNRSLLGQTAFQSLPAVGGLPQLLVSLSHHFQFAGPTECMLPGRVPAYSVIGRWRPEILATSGVEAAAHRAENSPRFLPRHVPHEVCIYVGQGDLFPFVIEFWRWDQRETGQGGVGGRGPTTYRRQRMVRLEFFDVRINTSIDPERFEFRPRAVGVVDNTEAFIKRVKSRHASADPTAVGKARTASRMTNAE